MINQVTRSFNTVTEKKRFIQINLLQKKATCFRKLLHAFVHGDILVLFNQEMKYTEKHKSGFCYDQFYRSNWNLLKHHR